MPEPISPHISGFMAYGRQRDHATQDSEGLIYNSQSENITINGDQAGTIPIAGTFERTTTPIRSAMASILRADPQLQASPGTFGSHDHRGQAGGDFIGFDDLATPFDGDWTINETTSINPTHPATRRWSTTAMWETSRSSAARARRTIRPMASGTTAVKVSPVGDNVVDVSATTFNASERRRTRRPRHRSR